MKFVTLFAFFLCLTSLLAGCGGKKDASTELQKAAAAMAQGDPVPSAAATEPVQQATAAAPAAQTAPTPTPAQEMNQAMTAYKAGDLDDAVRRLQNLRATPVLSAEKRMALNDATAAVMAEIYALADKGDTRAIQAVKLYEEMQTHHK